MTDKWCKHRQAPNTSGRGTSTRVLLSAFTSYHQNLSAIMRKRIYRSFSQGNDKWGKLKVFHLKVVLVKRRDPLCTPVSTGIRQHFCQNKTIMVGGPAVWNPSHPRALYCPPRVLLWLGLRLFMSTADRRGFVTADLFRLAVAMDTAFFFLFWTWTMCDSLIFYHPTSPPRLHPLRVFF